MQNEETPTSSAPLVYAVPVPPASAVKTPAPPNDKTVDKQQYEANNIDLSTIKPPTEIHTNKRKRGKNGISRLRLMTLAAILTLLLSLGTWLWMQAPDILVNLAANGRTTGVKIMLSLPGTNPNHVAANGLTPLTAAVQAGRQDMVWLLLSDVRTDVNQADSRGYPPLYKAAEQGYADIVRQLLAVPGIQYLKAAANGYTPAQIARQKGYINIAEQLETDKERALAELKKLGISEHELNQALCAAAAQGELSLLRTLLTAGADANTYAHIGRTPLILAVEGNHVACVKHLLATTGIDPNRGNENGVPPIWAAALCGHADSLRLLLATPGIDVNKADPDGQTALYWAAFNGRAECVRLLLAAPGIQVNKADRNGVTPLCRARQGGHAACVKLLLAAGAR